MNNVKNLIENERHLPYFLRDFHDQKDLFKALHGSWGDCKNGQKEQDEQGKWVSKTIPWVDGHIYTIDHFLRFMAYHGYTLQQCRAKVDFHDIHVTIKEIQDRPMKAWLEKKEKEMAKLTAEKDQAVKDSDYERACELRDKVETMRNQKPSIRDL